MRMLLSVLVLFIASRALIRLTPGDPLTLLVEDSNQSGSLAQIRSELALDQPLALAIGRDFKRLLGGDLGLSIQSRQPIRESLGPRLSTTFEIAIGTCLLGAILSLVVAGSSLYQIPWARPVLVIGSWCSMLPVAWVGPILLYLCAVQLQWADVVGSRVLPILVLALHVLGPWSALIRARLELASRSPIATAARAKGAGEIRIFLRHILAPNAGTLFVVIASQLGSLIGGSFVVEVIFNRRGLGSWMIDAVLARDYPVVEACIFIGGSLSILAAQLGFLAQRMWKPSP